MHYNFAVRLTSNYGATRFIYDIAVTLTTKFNCIFNCKTTHLIVKCITILFLNQMMP